MKTKRTYSTSDVEGFDVSTVVPLISSGCVVAIDVAKTNHMHAAKFEWKGADEARVEWTPWNEGKAGDPVVFDIKRVQ